MDQLLFLKLEIYQLLLSNKYCLVEDGHGNFTRMIKKWIVDQLWPYVSLKEQLPAHRQDVGSWRMFEGNGLSYVVYGVNNFNIDVQCL